METALATPHESSLLARHMAAWNGLPRAGHPPVRNSTESNCVCAATAASHMLTLSTPPGAAVKPRSSWYAVIWRSVVKLKPTPLPLAPAQPVAEA